MQKDANGNYHGAQPEYGHNAKDNPVKPEAGYALVPEGDVILEGDKPYDIYSGWIAADGWHARNKYHARSVGRWTAWERKVEAA